MTAVLTKWEKHGTRTALAPSKKIVVVDDDPDMVALMTEALCPPYEVKSANDGEQGLNLIRSERPDLVVLDLLMPRMHGFEVCKRVRADESLKNTKVIISSSKSYAHDIKVATGAGGADLYMVKPFDLGAFRGKIDEMLGHGDASAVALKFWGTRGSIASPGPRTQRYGGNTPCVEIRVGDQRLIIDAGTGLRELGNDIMKESQGKAVEAHMLIGHTHWDHIQGLPFFTPMYLPQNRFTVYGVHGTTQSFENVLRGQMNPTYFPVEMKEMASRVEIQELSGPIKIGDAKISYHYLNHPGITVGFRIETRRGTICYISDHEPYGKLNNKGEFSAKEDADVARFVHGADLLVCEAQYTDEEYRQKKSWGHSTFTDVIGLAIQAQAKRVALFHHDPSHTDEMMDRFVAECRAHVDRQGSSLDCFGAQEGASISL
jgi:phosphoribosyl 1,2-cyclic phosphodiesterase/ActR/RegA family two-component response regulator